MIELARSPEQIGNTIRRIRKKQGMSQSELGKKAGLRQETISLLENGNPAAKLETVLAVLSALGLEFRISQRKKTLLGDLPMATVMALPHSKRRSNIILGDKFKDEQE